jgi:hypothetical protein
MEILSVVVQVIAITDHRKLGKWGGGKKGRRGGGNKGRRGGGKKGRRKKTGSRGIPFS